MLIPTVRSLVIADVGEHGTDSLAQCCARVLQVIAEHYPYLITDADSARRAFNDVWAVWEDETGCVTVTRPRIYRRTEQDDER